MEPITLILTALAAGAGGGALDVLKDEAKAAVKAAHTKLRDLISARFRAADTVNGAVILAEYETYPDTFGKGLGKKLAEAGADDDEAILTAANAILEQLDLPGRQSGKYQVTVTGSSGVQIGDRGTQTNTFMS